MKYLNNSRSLADHSTRAYRADLLQIFHPLLELPLPSSGSEFKRQAHNGLSRVAGLEPASRARKAATVKGFARWLFGEGLISSDVSAQIRGPKVNPKLPTYLSVDEAMSLLRTLQDHAPWEDRVLLLLMYGGGLRVSEACELEWKNIEWGRRSLRVLGKGGKERLVVLPELVMKLMAERKQSAGRVFDPSVTTRKAYDLVRNWGAKAGLLKPLHPHALRHSYATHLLTSGADLRVLQELLGHSSLAATQKYTHINIDQLARTLESHHPLGKK